MVNLRHRRRESQGAVHLGHFDSLQAVVKKTPVESYWIQKTARAGCPFPAFTLSAASTARGEFCHRTRARPSETHDAGGRALTGRGSPTLEGSSHASRLWSARRTARPSMVKVADAGNPTDQFQAWCSSRNGKGFSEVIWTTVVRSHRLAGGGAASATTASGALGDYTNFWREVRRLSRQATMLPRRNQGLGCLFRPRNWHNAFRRRKRETRGRPSPSCLWMGQLQQEAVAQFLICAAI